MKINIHFLMILILATIVFLSDSFIYIAKINYWLAISISSIITIGLFCFVKKKTNINVKSDFSWFDLLFFVLVFLRLISIILMPDESYDVCSYHIYLQENPFIDKINFDFFPGRTINSFLYPLGDRMFYLFRMALG